jgi:hypothetical protein
MLSRLFKTNKMKQPDNYITVKHPYANALKWLDMGLKDLKKSERLLIASSFEQDEDNHKAMIQLKEQRRELNRAKAILEKHLEQ